MTRSDVVVLGAGIVGVSVALHLQQRGRSVTLLDRRAPGEETSLGNAGLIERASVVPYSFPRELAVLARYAMNHNIDAHYDPLFAPKVAPWLFRFWYHSAPERLARISAEMLPLIENSLEEHRALIQASGLGHLMREVGWIEVYRKEASLEDGVKEAKDLYAPHGLRYDVLDAAALKAREPALSDVVVGGIHWLDPASILDPSALVKGYAALFETRGGRIVTGDARSLEAAPGGWRFATSDGPGEADQAVVALGPWSDDVFSDLGYQFPLAVKRGYHMHYGTTGGAVLNHTLLDVDKGFLLATMARGVRLTTGVEFADRDAPPSPIQLDRAEPAARELLPLGDRLDSEPWLGRRPCLPDMKPVIGRAPRHDNLWFAFGHNHHGLTLGPVTGRLLAEVMAGETPFTDPAPYGAGRF
ncbi:FAD-binding oxidoreductase [Zavarzinia compransoris]|uniref:NAD(P)/FAD-dependent oxidoreductase n=1 Tax=Zavarzinia marina TaxID=2911065 RepID=UPI001F364AC1|nr:FAD-dependent oxidoreductase [Zavarzinia marina]MCF4166962.1 FAD-binding oxidoreductase [Zavarzinia marina]